MEYELSGARSPLTIKILIGITEQCIEETTAELTALTCKRAALLAELEEGSGR